MIGQTVKFQGKRDDWRSRPLVMITTNKERPLPQPFVRRCIVLEIPSPKRKLLKNIAKCNFPTLRETFFDDVLNAVLASQRGQAAAAAVGGLEQATDALAAPGQQPSINRDDEGVDISIAEYIDTLRACAALAEKPDELSQSLLNDIVKRTIWAVKEKALRPQ
jgi:hypothetical protein